MATPGSAPFTSPGNPGPDRQSRRTPTATPGPRGALQGTTLPASVPARATRADFNSSDRWSILTTKGSPPTRITRPITSARSSPQYRPGSGLQPLPPLPDSSGNVQSSRSHPPTAPGHASGCASGAQLTPQSGISETPQSGISETPQSGIFLNPSIYIPPLATVLMLLFSNLCGIVMSTGSDAL